MRVAMIRREAGPMGTKEHTSAIMHHLILDNFWVDDCKLCNTLLLTCVPYKAVLIGCSLHKSYLRMQRIIMLHKTL
jgi:hypothetical protein